MTHTSTEQPDALQIAEQLRAEWKSDALNYDTALEAADELERLHARVQELQAKLVAESARTANEKLRADRMTQQHSMQSKMHAELAHKLASQAQRVPLDYHTISMVHLQIGAVGQFDVTERVVRWTERAHGITQEKQG